MIPAKLKDWSPLDNVDRFRATVDKEGFDLQQGVIEYVDLVQACCQGRAPDTLANNPWPNAYITATVVRAVDPQARVLVHRACGVTRLALDPAARRMRLASLTRRKRCPSASKFQAGPLLVTSSRAGS